MSSCMRRGHREDICDVHYEACDEITLTDKVDTRFLLYA